MLPRSFPLVFVWITAGSVMWGQSKTPELDGLGEVLTEDRVFYRWQSTESGENLARLGKMSPTLNTYFMGLTEGTSAGPGIYLAGTPSSSASYLPASGGNLLEVRVAKGTRIVDLKDNDTLRKIWNLGLTTERLEANHGSEDGLLLRYTKDWFVGKNLTDKVTFELYPGRAASRTEVVEHLRGIREGPARRQALDQFIARRAGARADLLADPTTVDLALQTATPAEAKSVLRRHFANTVGAAEAGEIWSQVAARPELARALAKDEALRSRLIEDVRTRVDERIAQRSILDPGWEPLYEALLKDASLSSEQLAFVRKTLVRTYLRSPEMLENPDAISRRLVALLKATSLNAWERREFLSQMKQVVTHFERSLRPSPAALDVVRAGAGNDVELESRLQSLAARRRLIDRAIAEPTASHALAALRSGRSIEDLNVVHQTLNAALPTPVLRDAMGTFTRAHEPEVARLIEGAFDRSSGVAAQLGDDGFYDVLYRAAISKIVGDREDYLSSCIREPACRKNLVRQITGDDRLLEGFRDYSYIEFAMSKVTGEPKFKEELFSAIVKSAKSPRQLDQITAAFKTEARSAGAAELIRTRGQALARSDAGVVNLHDLCR